MTNKDFKEGMKVTCDYEGEKVEATLWHNTFLDIWWASLKGKGFSVIATQLTNIQPKFRTIDDLEEGDIIVDKDGYKKKCLARIGEVYAVSKTWGSVIPDNEVKTHSFWATIYELKNYGYTLYQPTKEKETESLIDKLDDCVKTFFSQADELIKNLKK